jgi:hypothetical protein
MGITLTQLINTVEKLKQYTDNNIPEISPEANNAIQSKDDGLFVDDKQPQIDFIRVKLDPIARYQRYVNTELDYIYCQINENQTIVSTTTPPNLTLIESNNIKLNTNSNGIVLKSGKTYNISASVAVTGNSANFKITDVTNNKEIGYVSSNINTVNGAISCIYTTDKDVEIQLIPCDIEVGALYSGTVGLSYIVAHEINRTIVIDPVEYVNTTQGIEDTPVGHIIAHMGNSAPEHYLACDGKEYNIVDYPYLVQHIEDNYGVANYFGGDGLYTFCVPNLSERFLKGSGTTGVYEEAGLPNITANWKSEPSAAPSGAVTIKSEKGTLDPVSGGGSTDSRVYFDASRSSPIYGNSETVTPSNFSILFCIKYEPTYYAIIKRDTTQEDISLLEEQVRLLKEQNLLLQHEITSLEAIIEAINRRQEEKEQEENGGVGA